MATAIERNPIRNRGLKMIPVDQEKRHDEWLQIRRGYIGGSDAGAIIGLNPYASAFSVWAEKTGKTPEFGGNISTRTGTLLEDLVARLFMEETGKKVQRLNFTIVNEEYPFACANIDREIIGEDAILECKTTTSYLNVKKFRTGEYPEQWYAQMTHYLAVTGAKKAYLAVLIECRDFRIFELERDEEEIKALMDAERHFWNTYVLTRKTPPVDGHSATSDTIKQMFTEEAGDNVDLSGLLDTFQRRKILKGQIDSLNEQMDSLDNSIKVAMGSNPKGTCGRFSVSWKIQNTNGLDRKKMKEDFPEIDFKKYATQSRIFRVTEKKEKSVA